MSKRLLYIFLLVLLYHKLVQVLTLAMAVVVMRVVDRMRSLPHLLLYSGIPQATGSCVPQTLLQPQAEGDDWGGGQ